ncbi:MAG: SH3 domain-containing protein [Ramlibacter sp.]|nr:SH3 domain-containing protein [Ramlibacter sp.]
MGIWACGLVVLFAGAAQAQDETVIMKRASELREAPAESARAVATLPAQASVIRLGERRGPWIQIRSGTGATGWVHMLDVGPAGNAISAASPAPAGNAATGALRGLTNLFSKGNERVVTPTATIGIRGLGAEDLAQAAPDMQAVGQMEALRQSERQALEFARGAALVPVDSPPLHAAPRPSSTGGAAPGNPEQVQ